MRQALWPNIMRSWHLCTQWGDISVWKMYQHFPMLTWLFQHLLCSVSQVHRIPVLSLQRNPAAGRTAVTKLMKKYFSLKKSFFLSFFFFLPSVALYIRLIRLYWLLKNFTGFIRLTLRWSSIQSTVLIRDVWSSRLSRFISCPIYKFENEHLGCKSGGVRKIQ